MSRFQNSGTFLYASGDVLTGATTVYLDANQMPQYPFDNETVTDRVNYRSKNGKVWSYENYNMDVFTFNFSLIDESKRNELRVMCDAKPILSFKSGTTSFGTFRFSESTWKDSESAFGL